MVCALYVDGDESKTLSARMYVHPYTSIVVMLACVIEKKILLNFKKLALSNFALLVLNTEIHSLFIHHH